MIYDYLLFLLFILFGTALSLWNTWNIWTSNFVKGEVVGYRVRTPDGWFSKLLRGKSTYAIIHYETPKESAEVEMSTYCCLEKPEGHHVRFWVKKRGKKIRCYLASDVLFPFALACAGETIFYTPVFPLVFLLAGAGFIIDMFLLKPLPLSFSKKTSRKLTKHEYKELNKKKDISYNDLMNLRYYFLTSVPAYTTVVVIAVTVVGFLVYKNWTHLP